MMIEFRKDSLIGFQDIEQTLLRLDLMMVKVHLGITHKVYMQELWFLHSAQPLMLVYVFMKFHDHCSLDG